MERYKCKFCKKKFINRNSRNRHEKSSCSQNSTKIIFQCHLCMKKYTRKDTLTNHIKSHNEKNFFCVKCNRSFSCRFNLIRHDENIHQHILPYQCENCNKRFRTYFTLICHIGSIGNPIVI